MATEETPAPAKTLDDVLATFDEDPSLWKPTLYVSWPMRGPNGATHKNTPGDTLGPITGIVAPIDLDFVWRELVARTGPPGGDVVVRLLPAPGKQGGRSVSVGVNISEAAVARWGVPVAPPAPRPVQAPAPPQQQLQQPYAQPYALQAAPPVDMVQAILLGQQKSQEQTQQLLNTLLASVMQKTTDPYMQTVIQQNQQLQQKINELMVAPKKMEDDQFQKALEFGKDLASKENNALALLAEPISSLSKSIEKTIDKRANVEEKKAETEAMRADAELTDKRIKLLQLQLEAAKAGVLQLSDEDQARGQEALDEVARERAAAQAVEDAKQKTAAH